MKFFVIFIVAFIIIFLAYLLTVILNKKKLEKFKNSNQALFFVRRYKIKVNEDNVKVLAYLVAIANAFIIAFTLTIVELVENIILKILVAFLIIMPLILILYSLIGKYMKKRGNK